LPFAKAQFLKVSKYRYSTQRNQATFSGKLKDKEAAQ
jgi:hypothetical protein